MCHIKNNIQQVREQIDHASQKCGRLADSVQLIAVSKTKPIEAIADAIAAGQQAFGENYVQEGVEKIDYFAQHHPEARIEWHFIGPIQSNKTRLIAEHFDWVHSVDRLKIAKRLSEQRPAHLPPLNVLVQVNTSGEASKSGLTVDNAIALIEDIRALPGLNVRGLMSIPQPEMDYQRQCAAFEPLSNAFHALREQTESIDTLSMGMSGDMEAAIACGSTMVRVGTAIFGARDSR
ncbi:YggS family pyridoxal phosphate-dependent enzyme [Salinivibrio sp. ML290]|uniref:YggS family pyridoxal phosphate-dependent enzyme n=1 Tax=Salinivibrio sp. ML290 TaxID=1909468 RepID=UPI0009888FB9|nr:YggS family pyridoxal phosphate-dependent enzyme [Salinivibrio sp. ML290]OOE75296.1 YggS family pyridoxal phosphate enzyme [Salinivibrio sp. ML290]